MTNRTRQLGIPLLLEFSIILMIFPHICTLGGPSVSSPAPMTVISFPSQHVPNFSFASGRNLPGSRDTVSLNTAERVFDPFCLTQPYHSLHQSHVEPTSYNSCSPACTSAQIRKIIVRHLLYKLFKTPNTKTKLKACKFLVLMTISLILQANDIELNPGPVNNSSIYPCGTCDKAVTWEHRGVVCETCDQWYHIDCQDIHSQTYVDLNNSMVSWHCIVCNQPNYSDVPFDLYGLSTSNRFSELSEQINLDNQTSDSLSDSPNLRYKKPIHSSTPKKENNTRKILNDKRDIPLRILNINFQSLKNKLPLLINTIDTMKPDIIIGTETWLNPSIKDSEIFPQNFKIFRKDRNTSPTCKTGGGVLLAISDQFICDEALELSPDDDTEIVWAKINIKGKKTLYVSSFYNPKTSDTNSLVGLEKSLKRASNIKNAAVIMGGDFNLPGFNWEDNSLKPGTNHTKQHYCLIDILNDTGLTQIVKEPTRNGNILDLIITNLPNQVSRSKIIPGISDHDIVYTEFHIAPHKTKLPPRNIPIYKNANWNSIKSELTVLYEQIIKFHQEKDVDSLWNIFKCKLHDLIKEHIPHKQIKSKSSLPWISAELKKLIQKRNRLYKKAKKSGDSHDRSKAKELKHIIQRKIRQTYWKYIEDIITPNAQSHGNPMKRFWSYIKSKKTDYNGISALKQNGKLVQDPKSKAEALNNQFQSVFNSNKKLTPEQFQNKCHIPSKPQYPIMPTFEITTPGICKLLKNLNINKAAGPDEIKPKVLHDLAEQIAPILTILFQKSLSTGQVPLDWKNANISPIYKKGEKTNPENYRPISLTCICSKILEHIVCSNIMNHSDKHNILYPLQHGFQKSKSCVSQLIEFTNDVALNVDNGKQTDILIMDFSKAFDKVNHTLLLHKLRYYGINEQVITWLGNLLEDRRQSVVLEGERSEPLEVKSGVPQGSVIGPCLFLFYINDIPVGIDSTVRLFADDTIMYLTISSMSDAQKLQNDLDKLASWENKWDMSFHPQKCNVLSITNNRSIIHYPYILHGNLLEHVDKAKYLGVTLQSNFKWDAHINNITNKAYSTLGFLRRNLKINSPKIKQQAYFSLVRPSLEYACAVWDPHTQRDKSTLEMVQRRAARYVTNRHRNRSSVGDMLDRLNWDSLEDRRTKMRLSTFYQITKSSISVDKNILVKPQRLSRNMHQHSFQKIACRTEVYKYSFFPRTVVDWNRLPPDIATSESITSFKSTLQHYKLN